MWRSIRSRLVIIRRIWKHKAVRAALILWAILGSYDLALSEIIPESIANRFPKAREAIAMTSGWLPWWLWLAVLAAILVGASFEFAVRRAAGGEPPQVPASSKVKEWKKPLVAIELFAERTLVEEKNKWSEKFLKSSDLQANAEQKITELRKQAAKGADKSSSLRSENARLDVAAMGIRFAQDELKRAWAAIRQDIGHKLEKRILVAKGIAAPHAPGEKEMEIPAYEWRILEIDPIDETAVGKNDGKTKYLGVVIGRQD